MRGRERDRERESRGDKDSTRQRQTDNHGDKGYKPSTLHSHTHHLQSWAVRLAICQAAWKTQVIKDNTKEASEHVKGNQNK